MKEEKQYKNKMGMFDFIKGIAILAVVFWHTIELWGSEPGFSMLITLNGIFGACWMPAFLLSSAYWYKPKPVKKYVRSQFKGLIMPYIKLELLVWLSFSVVHYIRWKNLRGTLSALKSLIYGTLLGNMTEFYIDDLRICGIGPMWFIMTLFFANIILNVIMTQENIKEKKVPIIILTIIGLGCGKLTVQPYSFSAALAAVLSLYVGYNLKKTKFLIRKWRKKDYALIWGLIIASYIVVGGACQKGLYCNAVYVVFGIPMGIIALRFGLWISSKMDNKIMQFFKKLGRYTFWILMVHTLEVMSIDWSWFKNWHVLSGIPPFLNFVAVMVIRMSLVAFGCVTLSKINKYYIRWKNNGIIGRTKNIKQQI